MEVRERTIHLLQSLEANASSGYPTPPQLPADDLVRQTILEMHLASVEHLIAIRTLAEIDCTHTARSLLRGLAYMAISLAYWDHLASKGQDWERTVLGYLHDGLCRQEDLDAKAVQHELPGARQRSGATKRRKQEFERICRERYGLQRLPRRWDPDKKMDTILRALEREKTAWIVAYLSGAVHSDRLYLALQRRKILANRIDLQVPDDAQGIYITGAAAAHYFALAHVSTASILGWDTLPAIASFAEKIHQDIKAIADLLGLEEAYEQALRADAEKAEGRRS